MKYHSKLLLAIILLSATFLTPLKLMAENTSIKKPDFAFPVKVRTEASARYKTAIKQNNYSDALRALIDIALAETAIAPDSAGTQAAEIEQFANNCKNKAVSSLAYLVCAEIYNDIYTANKWNYDKRVLPLLPLDSNIKAWSGEQFRYKINSLCNSAISNPDIQNDTPLDKFKNLISIPVESRPYFPTLYYFTVSKVIELKSAHLSGDSRLPVSALSVDSAPKALRNTRPQLYDIISLYDSLINDSRKESAPHIFWTLEKLKFVKNKLNYSAEEKAHSKYREILLQLYKDYSSSPYCSLPLLELTNSFAGEDNMEEIKTLYSYVKSTLSRFPEAPLANCLKNYLLQTERKSVEIAHNSYLIPGGKLQVKVNAKNVPEAYLSLYRLPDDFTDLNNYVRNSAKSVKTDSKTVRFSGKVPFNGTDSVDFTIDRPGRYLVIPSFTGVSKNNEYYQVIHVSALTSGAFMGEKNSIVVVEPVQGYPVEGAEIIGFKRKNNAVFTENFGKTDINGLKNIPKRFNGTLRPVKESDRFAGTVYLYNHEGADKKTRSSINLFCDLPVYHPGDSLNWALVAYSYSTREMNTLSGKTINVTLFDANHSKVDTINVTTDAFGRASGQFFIPEGLLTGRYTLSAVSSDDIIDAQGNLGVLVSDYKLPTYILENLTVLNDTPQKGYTTLTGVAKTFSGVPLSGISVKIDVASLPNWWRAAGSSESFFSGETVTDSKGEFKFTLTDTDFELAPDGFGAFSAMFTANSVTGESATAQKIFTLGAKYRIIANIASDINISKPVHINVYVSDTEGLPAKESLSFKVISEAKDTVLNGSIEDGNPVDLTKLESGIYSFVFYAKDAEQVVIKNIAVYRPEDNLPPRKSTVWVPVKSVTNGDSLLFGTSNKTTNILYTIVSGNKIITRKWLNLAPGIHNIDVTVPAEYTDAQLWLFSIADYKTTTEKITIKPSDPLREISLIAETWRDKLIPGSQETLTLKVSASDSTPVKAAVMLDMFNAALTTFGKHSLNFYPRKGYVPMADFTPPTAYSYSYANRFSPFSGLKCSDISTPELNTYNQSFNRLRLRGMSNVYYKARSLSNGKIESDDADGGEVLYETATIDMALPAGMAVKEVEEEASENENVDVKNDNFEYRNSEVPLAFFSPMLYTDSNGSLSYSYSVPNANTTWLLSAMAFTSDLKTASLTRSAVASKPLMVSPNLPRFMRTGDELYVESQIFNTTGESVSAITEILIINPVNGETLQSDTYENEVDANGSVSIRTKVQAPMDLQFICFRIKSSTTGFSDGEQALIPVLPSSTPVIESTDFYIPANKEEYALTLPEYSTDSKITLTYCDNPVWYAVTALPGISEKTTGSSTDAAKSLFSAAVAEGLVKRYPQIAESIRDWSSNPDDSTLTSMLERNADMKSLLISATPWMQDAQNDSERMLRLALLLDSKNCNKAIDDAIKCIEKLQCENGGIAWMSQYKYPSLWSTTNILTTLGKLNSLGFLPENSRLKGICDKALTFVQNEYSTAYMKNPKGNFSRFAIIASLWSDFKPSDIGRSMITSENQRIIKNWKNMGIAEKAESAALLYKSGNRATAKTILSSLDEYATVSKERGMWWQPLSNGSSGLETVIATAKTLAAYSLITPDAPQIEKITQWLVLQKQALNWGSSEAATEIVASILTACPEWISGNKTIRINLGGKMLCDTTTGYTGEIKVHISPVQASGEALNILRSGKTPAWGGIVSFDNKKMDSVKGAECSMLKISKQFVKTDGNSATASDTLKIGDKVKITLTITSESAIDYLTIIDSRAACFEPVNQIPAPVWSDGICFYRENRDSSTNLFVEHLPKGTYVIEYEMWVNNAGVFASGIATAQSQYAPEITAHSGGTTITVRQ